MLAICPENHQEIEYCPLRRLRKPPRNRNNLTDHFRILVKSVSFIAMVIPRVLMDNECAIFDPATRGKVDSIALENNIDRLLPKRLRHKMKRCLSAAVDHDNQSVCQRGVNRIIVSANPEEIIQGDVRGTRKYAKECRKKNGTSWHTSNSFSRNPVLTISPDGAFDRHSGLATGQVAVWHRFHASVREVDCYSFHHGVKLQA